MAIADIAFTVISTPVKETCGTSNGANLVSAPTTKLCTVGTASSVSGFGPWNWTCAGSNGGSTASCSALLTTNGSCSAANGVAVSSAPTTGLCSAGSASSVTGTGPWTWSCTGSNGGASASCSAPITASNNCLFSATGYSDGCASAAAGAPQFPTMLNGYSARPPWDVAGVDYPVGVPTGTALTVPTNENLPAGCSLSGSTVTCSSGTPTLNAFNFTNITLSIIGGNVTVTNSLFVVGSNQGALGRIISMTGNASATFAYDEFNGNNVAVTSQQGQMVNISSTGIDTFKYCYFHNAGGDTIDWNTGSRTTTILYSLFKDVGVNTSHADALQWDGSTETNPNVSFDTIWQSGNEQSGNSTFGLYDFGGGSMANGVFGNNVVIEAAACIQCNFTLILELGPPTIGGRIFMHDIFIDPTGSLNNSGTWLYPNGFYADPLPNPAAIANIMNMTTAVTYTSYPTSGTYHTVPDNNGYTPPMSDIYSVTASPATGTVNAGGTIAITFDMDEPYTFSGGTPTMSLNSGGTATYTSGSGTNTVTFTYTVAAGQTATNLSLTALNLNGTEVKDPVGNTANLSSVAGTTFTGLAISGGNGKATNGACGASNGVTLPSAPTSGLCTTGTASAVSGSGP